MDAPVLRESSCVTCLATFTQPVCTGRPRVYCSDACKRTAIANRKKALAARPPEHRPSVVSSIRDLTPPRLGDEALERAAQLLDGHPEHRGVFLVVGDNFGPHLTSRVNVGGLIAKARQPCLVIDLDLLPAVEDHRVRSGYGITSR